MLPIGIFAALPFIFKQKNAVTINYLKITAARYAGIALTTTILILLLCFNLNFVNMYHSFLPAIKFILQPGGTEPLYNFLQVIINYKFYYFMIFNIIIVILSLININKIPKSSKYILLCIIPLMLLLWFFILKRGATMTLFESTYGLTILSMGLMKVLKESNMFKKLIFRYFGEFILFIFIILGINQYAKSIDWILEVSKNEKISLVVTKK